MKKHITPAARFIFDAETALKSAYLAVLGLSSALKYRLGESDRKEIVAETVAKAWTHRASYDPGKASFPTWVGRIARNTLLDHIRKNNPKDNVAGQADEGILAKAPDILMMEDESLDAVMKAVSSLPESYRRIILLLVCKVCYYVKPTFFRGCEKPFLPRLTLHNNVSIFALSL